MIPNDTNIRVTHGRVQNILDKTVDGTHVGCSDLLSTVKTTKPSVFIGRHVHEAYGTELTGDTLFISPSVLNEDYIMMN